MLITLAEAFDVQEMRGRESIYLSPTSTPNARALYFVPFGYIIGPYNSNRYTMLTKISISSGRTVAASNVQSLNGQCK